MTAMMDIFTHGLTFGLGLFVFLVGALAPLFVVALVFTIFCAAIALVGHFFTSRGAK